MPSGFQQDNNQLTPGFYRVVINMGALGEGSSATWYQMNDNDGDTTTGRITTYSWDSALNNDGTTDNDSLPPTQEVADALARGNLRFQAIVEELSKYADCQFLDIENYGNSNAEAQVDQGAFSFTVKYDRNEHVLIGYNAFQKTLGLGTSGTFEIEGVTYTNYANVVDSGYVNNTESAIKDIVMRALLRDYTNSAWERSTRVFVPLLDSDPLIGDGDQRIIVVAFPFNNTGDAYSDISVNNLDGTDTTISFD